MSAAGEYFSARENWPHKDSILTVFRYMLAARVARDKKVLELGCGNGDLASAAIFDLRENLIEHPCYVIVQGMRAYVSASTLGGVVALDLSGWAAGLSRAAAPGDNMRQRALV